MGTVEFRNVAVDYGGGRVVLGLDLQVADGELVSILGPSGAGKTTILRAAAGLAETAEGDILIDGRPMKGVPPDKRDAVMVFQKPLLFPFMDVFQNASFGLRMKGRLGRGEKRKVMEMLETVGLAGLERRRAHELSGGQQQRVSLARALVLEPSVLLLDEPLASLDANLRERMRELIRSVQAETGVTTLLVTHDQTEALSLGDRVVLILGGRPRQTGTPEELFSRPADRETARFFGGANFFTGSREGNVLHTAYGSFEAPPGLANGAPLTATVRPEDIVVAKAEGPGDGLEGVIRRVGFEGPLRRLWIQAGGEEIVALAGGGGHRAGDRVRVFIPPEKAWVFAEEAGDIGRGAGHEVADPPDSD